MDCTKICVCGQWVEVAICPRQGCRVSPGILDQHIARHDLCWEYGEWMTPRLLNAKIMAARGRSVAAATLKRRQPWENVSRNRAGWRNATPDIQLRGNLGRSK